MAQPREKRDNSGILFVNDRKERETHPDRNGSATIDGVDYWVSGWNKQDKNGNPMVSLAFKKKEAPNRFERKPAEPPKPTQSRRDELDEDLPF